MVLALPWVLAGVLHPSGGVSDPAGVPAFAARGENWGGALLAVLGHRRPVERRCRSGQPGVGADPGGHARPAGARRLRLGGRRAASRAAARPSGPRGRGRAAGRRRCRARARGGARVRGARGARGRPAARRPEVGGLVGAAARARRRARVPGSCPRAPERGSARCCGAVVAGAALLLPVAALPDLAWGVGRLAADGRLPGRLAAGAGRAGRATGIPGDVLVLPFGTYRAFALERRRGSRSTRPRAG